MAIGNETGTTDRSEGSCTPLSMRMVAAERLSCDTYSCSFLLLPLTPHRYAYPVLAISLRQPSFSRIAQIACFGDVPLPVSRYTVIKSSNSFNNTMNNPGAFHMHMKEGGQGMQHTMAQQDQQTCGLHDAQSTRWPL